MKKNIIMLKSPSSITNTSAIVRVHNYKDGKFYPTYGWTIPNLSTNANNIIEINLDPDNVLQSMRGLQDTLPFGCTISIECPVGSEPMWISDMYATNIADTNAIIDGSNLDVSKSEIRDIKTDGNIVSATFTGLKQGEFELYEIENGDTLENAVIKQYYSANISANSTSIQATLPNQIGDDNKVLARWRTAGEQYYSKYTGGRQSQALKAVVIDRHELINGNLIIYIYDRDTLAAFNESALVLTFSKGGTEYLIRGTINVLPNRTAVLISGTDLDKIIALGGIVTVKASVVGAVVSSNTYNLNIDTLVPTTPGGGTSPTPGGSPSGTKYLVLNKDKVAVNPETNMIYLSFDVSNDTEVEMLNIKSISGGIIARFSDVTLTARQLSIRPSFGFWMPFTGDANDIWSKTITYEYRIKGFLNKEETVTLSPELPYFELEFKVKEHKLYGEVKYNVQRGENQRFNIKGITLMKNTEKLYEIPGVHTPNEENIIKLDVSAATKNLRETTKITYEYTYAGKPYSTTVTWADTAHVLATL